MWGGGCSTLCTVFYRVLWCIIWYSKVEVDLWPVDSTHRRKAEVMLGHGLFSLLTERLMLHSSPFSMTTYNVLFEVSLRLCVCVYVRLCVLLLSSWVSVCCNTCSYSCYPLLLALCITKWRETNLFIVLVCIVCRTFLCVDGLFDLNVIDFVQVPYHHVLEFSHCLK